MEDLSFLWLVASGAIGGLIAETIRFVFERVFGPRLERAREAKTALRHYSYPLLRTADALDARMANLIRFSSRGWFDKQDDPHYRLSTLYLLGCYFGWCKILEDAAFLEFERSDRRARRFNVQFYRVFKALTSQFYVAKVEPDDPDHEVRSSIPRLILTGVGELMIHREDKTGEPRTISFLEFTDRYLANKAFPQYFGYFERLLGHLSRDPKEPRWNRLLSFATNLRVLVAMLDPTSRGTSHRRIHYLSQMDPSVQERLRRELERAGYDGMIVEPAPDRSRRRSRPSRGPSAKRPGEVGSSLADERSELG